MATGDAPIYFEGPVKIGDRFYVDGGVGGNCPLKQVSMTNTLITGAQFQKDHLPCNQ